MLETRATTSTAAITPRPRSQVGESSLIPQTCNREIARGRKGLATIQIDFPETGIPLNYMEHQVTSLT
jgi:hypothetical protein